LASISRSGPRRALEVSSLPLRCSLATVEIGDFARFPFQSTSPLLNLQISHPPFAAPAAGGWGIPDSRRVHNVGFVGWPVDGVVEAVARSERLFAAELIPSCGGVPQSVARTVRLPRARTSPNLFDVSSPPRILTGGGSGCRIWIRMLYGDASPRRWWSRASDLVVRRLPSCRGHRVEQWQQHTTGPFWPPTWSGSGGPLCNLCFWIFL
jgi:hypothetical protein